MNVNQINNGLATIRINILYLPPLQTAIVRVGSSLKQEAMLQGKSSDLVSSDLVSASTPVPERKQEMETDLVSSKAVCVTSETLRRLAHPTLGVVW